MWTQSWMPDVSWLPLFDWAENRDLQQEAYEMWLKWHTWVTSNTKESVWDIISIDQDVQMPNEEQHFLGSYLDDSWGMEIWYNFTHNWSHFRLVADVEIENRRHNQMLFDISRVPHLKNVRFFRGYDAIGYREIKDTSFLDLGPICSKASIFFVMSICGIRKVQKLHKKISPYNRTLD